MVQIDAYKLLFTGKSIILGMVKDVRDEDWFKPLPGLGRSFDWVFGHYAAVEDWFLHHLNGDPYETSTEWQDMYWADNSGPVDPTRGIGRAGVTAAFEKNRQRLFTALKLDLFHLKRCIKPGIFPSDVKTRGDAWLFISAHAYWHVGELESMRGMNGYPYNGGGIHH